MKILFVEDDKMNRRVVGEMLKAARIEMSEAENALDGLSMIDSHDYDLVLMDLRMPGMDGLEAIQHIRRRTDEKRFIPIIVVTADTAMDLRGECLEKGADEFMIKPVEIRALFETIAFTIAKAKKAAEARKENPQTSSKTAFG